MDKKYYSSSDLCEMFDVDKTTLWRWRKRKVNPFPDPDPALSTGNNRWHVAVVDAWKNDGSIEAGSEVKKLQEEVERYREVASGNEEELFRIHRAVMSLEPKDGVDIKRMPEIIEGFKAKVVIKPVKNKRKSKV